MTFTGVHRVGVIIVGSLLWDLDKFGRRGWQNERLRMGLKRPVKAQIRYGRRSSGTERRDQYTMTLSCTAQAGIAYAVPCNNVVSTIGGLETEAHALAAAEGLVDDSSPRWKQFGVVGAAVQDANSIIGRRLLEQWSRCFGCRHNIDTRLWEKYEELKEDPPVSRDGVLTIEWPTDVSSGLPAPFDLLLAAATVPSPINRRYAWPSEIAESLVNDARSAEYFQENVLHGIRTHDDRAIWSEIEALRPDWIQTGRYPEVAELLGEST